MHFAILINRIYYFFNYLLFETAIYYGTKISHQCEKKDESKLKNLINSLQEFIKTNNPKGSEFDFHIGSALVF